MQTSYGCIFQKKRASPLLISHQALQDVGQILLIRVLENHVFLGTRINPKISARHDFIDDAQLRASSGCAAP
jgi:hypothetical protein